MNDWIQGLGAGDFGQWVVTATASPSAPWVLVIAALVLLVLALFRRIARASAEYGEQQLTLLRHEQEIAVLNERLEAGDREMDQVRSATARQIEEMTRDRQALRHRLEVLTRDYAELQRTAEVRDSTRQEQLNAAAARLQLLERAEQRLHTTFENLANRIFEDKHEKFSEASRQGMESLLGPMRQQLRDFRQRVDEVYDRENEQRTTLRAEIDQLRNLNERISEDALNLTNALKGDSKVRGNWGEVQLERLLEESGLRKGREYDLQVSLVNEDGRRLQPDAVVHLPENKDVIVDSKVSLVAYEAYQRAATDEDRRRLLRDHLRSLRNHVQDLGGKNYDELVGVRSLDMVLLFVPIEPALLLALEHEPGLYNEAFDRGIVLVSPTLLMTTLQIIHNIWRYENQNNNALVIAREAGNLYDQFVRFTESLEKVGDHLRKAEDSYRTAKNQLTEGRGNLVRRTEQIRQLGAKTRKSIAPDLLERAEAEAEANSAADDAANGLSRVEPGSAD